MGFALNPIRLGQATVEGNNLSSLPYGGIRIAEKSRLLTGRLIGQMFADQGAHVCIERNPERERSAADDYFDRNKIVVAPGELDSHSSFDVVVVDGAGAIDRLPGQLVVRVVAALPDDSVYGELADDCDEGLLSALVGFFTDMGQISRPLGRPVIYTPLPLCSVYAAVNGANMLAASLIDRQRTGSGRQIWVSRLAGGVSAIGVLGLTIDGLPAYLSDPAQGPLSAVPEAHVDTLLAEARTDGQRQLWLEEHLSPFASPFPTKDGRMALCVGINNRRLAERMLRALGIHDAVIAAGFVDENPYDPDNVRYRGRNLAEPRTLSWEYTSKLADMVAGAIKTKTAGDWERIFCEQYRTPGVKVHSWDEWRTDPDARTALIFAPVDSARDVQIGRVAWIDSARPYPRLKLAEPGSVEPASGRDLAAVPRDPVHRRPLEGVTIADFTNVVAGPNSGRAFAELGAAVIKIDPIDPFHSPDVMVDIAGEHGAGKQSLILNTGVDEGRSIVHQILGTCDAVLANKLDHQWQDIGIDRATLDGIKPGILQVALTAHRGESKDNARHDYPGYDHALQGTTGIMVRFGPDGCPTFHGLASCVDYLCGYLGTWAGLTAMFANAKRNEPVGDWAETSLAVAATLTQLLLQYSREPESARGADATGQTSGARVYELSDGWIYADGERDLTDDLDGLDRKEAQTRLKALGIPAVPVQSCRELADRHLTEPTPTVTYHRRQDQGWTVGTFDTSWFTDERGQPLGSPHPAHRVGSDADTLLENLGYSASQIADLRERHVVGAREFSNPTVP